MPHTPTSPADLGSPQQKITSRTYLTSSTKLTFECAISSAPGKCFHGPYCSWCWFVNQRAHWTSSICWQVSIQVIFFLPVPEVHKCLMKLPRERAGQSRADKTCWEGEWRWLLHLKSTLPTFYPRIIFNFAPRVPAQECNRGSRSDGSFELEPTWWHKTVESIQAGENINLEVWITFLCLQFQNKTKNHSIRNKII